ncbi:MAG TPA: peptidylprolyl isomerase, partial [Chloroflexia bacterium]|nr:peptidylprolyl isomerase [Chloroflexia bacterium]
MKIMTVDTSRGQIVIQLSDDASVKNTVAHFEKKANAGDFDGLTFHRVEGWVIQGGDPTGTGTGGGKIPAEYNKISFVRGAVGVARGPDRTRNSDCQWFVVKRDATSLDGDYTNFGTVIIGMDVADQIKQRD